MCRGLVGVSLILTIFSFTHFFQQLPSRGTPHQPPSLSIADFPGVIPKVLPHRKNPGLLTQNAGLLECAVRICRIRRPHPLAAHPQCLLTSCSCPSSPPTFLVSLPPPPSMLTPPPAADPQPPGALGWRGRQRQDLSSGQRSSQRPGLRAMADLPEMGGSAWPHAGRLEAWVPMAVAHNIQLFSLQPCSLPSP